MIFSSKKVYFKTADNIATDLQIKRVFWVVLVNGVMTPLFPRCD